MIDISNPLKVRSVETQLKQQKIEVQEEVYMRYFVTAVLAFSLPSARSHWLETAGALKRMVTASIM
jgi:hypothetical protein